MEYYHTYILFSPEHGKYYIGHTQDVDKRLNEHNYISKKSYTSKYRPWELKVKLKFSNRSQAMKAEKYLKKKPRHFLKKVIEDKGLQDYILKKFG